MTPDAATPPQMEASNVAPAPSLDGAALGDSPCSDDSCRFCTEPRQLKPNCQKQRWMVCRDHFMVTCPECGHEAFWMEKMKSGKSYYACFRVEPWCNWTSDIPPNIGIDKNDTTGKSATQ
jgi:hypothetical protein